MTVAAVQLGLFGSAEAQPGTATPQDMMPTTQGSHTSFGPLKQIRAGALQVGYAEAGPAAARGPPPARLAVRHPQLTSMSRRSRGGGIPGDRAVSAWLRHRRFIRATVAQRPAVGARLDIIASDGCAEDPKGDPRAVRLGRAHRGHRRGAVAGTLQGLVSVSGYLIGNQEAGKRRWRRRMSTMVVPVLFRDRAWSQGYEKYRRDFAKLIWQLASPQMAFDEHVRAQRGGVRQSRSRQHRDPQLSLAARPRRW